MKSKQKITLLVTDLDNTLYDWVSFFVPSFYAMVNVASKILKMEEVDLLDELQTVHRKYENTEHPFALLETRSVIEKFPALGRKELAHELDAAFHAFNRARKERLCLYPGVEDTLSKIREFGTHVVAHTEARVANSLFRVQMLGIDSLIERLYAPESEDLGHPTSESAEFTAARLQLLTRLPDNHRKPDPKVLLDICSDFGATPRDTLYVGDNLTRDIFMAKTAGVHSAWAHYGGIFNPALWENLVRVTHWTKKESDREGLLKEKARDTRPDIELHAFTEILDHFEFAPGHIRVTRKG